METALVPDGAELSEPPSPVGAEELELVEPPAELPPPSTPELSPVVVDDRGELAPPEFALPDVAIMFVALVAVELPPELPGAPLSPEPRPPPLLLLAHPAAVAARRRTCPKCLAAMLIPRYGSDPASTPAGTRDGIHA
jgi:hypothetical protein